METMSDFLTTKEVATLLGLSEYTVRKKIREGEIKAIEPSSSREGWKIDKKSLYEYEKNNKKSMFGNVLYRTIAGAGAGLLARSVLPGIGIPLAVAAGAGAAVASIMSSEKDSDGKDVKMTEAMYNLEIERVDNDIKAIELQIERQKLEEDSVENKRIILDLELQITNLKREKQGYRWEIEQMREQ